MASSQSLRVISKARYNEQIFLEIPFPSNSLAPSSIRVQTALIGLSSNNLAYCAAGHLLHWWDTYPLPTSTPPPYNNDTEYGVGVGWGFAKVLESTIDEIEPGKYVYGFLPVSSHTIDLLLQRSEQMPSHWIETSPHRSKVMSLYQRYMVQPDDFVLDTSNRFVTERLSTGVVFEASHVLVRYCFPQDGQEPIHPLGNPVSPWTEKEADLTDTCIVCVAAGSKTSRGFVQQLAADSATATNPASYSVVEITNSPVGCESYLSTVPFPHTRLSYADISPASFSPHKKFIILNFGGRGNSLRAIYDTIKNANSSSEIIVISIGAEAKVFSADDMKARGQTAAELKAVQMNTTGIRDRAMERLGEAKYFEIFQTAFRDMVQSQLEAFPDGKVLGVSMNIKEGMRGVNGIEGLWNRLAAGQLPGDEGTVIKLDVRT